MDGKLDTKKLVLGASLSLALGLMLWRRRLKHTPTSPEDLNADLASRVVRLRVFVCAFVCLRLVVFCSCKTTFEVDFNSLFLFRYSA